MQPRMNNPVMVIPDAMKAILALVKTTRNGSVPEKTIERARREGCNHV